MQQQIKVKDMPGIEGLSGALRLYESMGFEQVTRWTEYHKNLE